jgi:hypothetical protein
VLGPNLERVIPVGVGLGEHLTVVSVELYEDGVIVRWIDTRGAPVSPPPDWRQPVIGLSDDIDTTYQYEGSSSGVGDGGPLRGETEFTPSLPPGAAALQVLGEGDAIEVSVGP